MAASDSPVIKESLFQICDSEGLNRLIPDEVCVRPAQVRNCTVQHQPCQTLTRVLRRAVDVVSPCHMPPPFVPRRANHHDGSQQGLDLTSFRQVVDIDLRWSEDSPMKLCFDNPDNEEYQSEWHPLQPPLPGATILSQNVLDYDIRPSTDNFMRWSLDAQMKDDGSAVRAIVRRRCDTLPSGLLLRVVVDNVHTQTALLMQYVKQLDADQTALQARVDKPIVPQPLYNAQAWDCNLHGMTIGDGVAQMVLDQDWATVNDRVAKTKRDYKFRVIFGLGNHNNGPAPMKTFVQNWFISKRLECFLDASEAVFFHVIRHRAN